MQRGYFIHLSNWEILIDHWICICIFIFYCRITNYHKFGRLNTHTFIISQLAQESQYGLGGSSVSQGCNQDLVLESHLKLDWGRICLLAHVVINRNKVLKLSDEGLSNVLTITQRSPLFPCQMDLSIWQRDSSKPAKKSTVRASQQDESYNLL